MTPIRRGIRGGQGRIIIIAAACILAAIATPSRALAQHVVLVVNGFTKGDWLEAFLFALSIAVGLTPEMLPMIVTSTLAKGAVLLSRSLVSLMRADRAKRNSLLDLGV